MKTLQFEIPMVPILIHLSTPGEIGWIDPLIHRIQTRAFERKKRSRLVRRRACSSLVARGNTGSFETNWRLPHGRHPGPSQCRCHALLALPGGRCWSWGSLEEIFHSEALRVMEVTSHTIMMTRGRRRILFSFLFFVWNLWLPWWLMTHKSFRLIAILFDSLHTLDYTHLYSTHSCWWKVKISTLYRMPSHGKASLLVRNDRDFEVWSVGALHHGCLPRWSEFLGRKDWDSMASCPLWKEH